MSAMPDCSPNGTKMNVACLHNHTSLVSAMPDCSPNPKNDGNQPARVLLFSVRYAGLFSEPPWGNLWGLGKEFSVRYAGLFSEPSLKSSHWKR